MVTARTTWNADDGSLTLTLSQRCPKVGIETRAGSPEKQPFHIPFAIGLLGADGHDLPLRAGRRSRRRQYQQYHARAGLHAGGADLPLRQPAAPAPLPRCRRCCAISRPR
ncbi:DUF3458 domain-containing protein [Cupriavidus basilensis]